MRVSVAAVVGPFLIALLLTACSTSRYSMEYDAAPIGRFDASQIPDAVPKWEPISRKGNSSPYTVRGKTYQITDNAQGFEQQGIASWYGLKFHGELTSNGEIYNMYDMTAAHKTLPLPSYVSVTNLDNQRRVIVRINDRGPFHEGRIIDLSYAAAVKLGYSDKGTANVKLETITVASKAETSVLNGKESRPVVNDRLAQFVQVAAYASPEAAQATAAVVEKLIGDSLVDKVVSGENLVFVAVSPDRSPPVYRVRVGPLQNQKQVDTMIGMLKSAKVGQPMLITRAMSAKAQ